MSAHHAEGARIDVVVGESDAVDAVPWPWTRENVSSTSAALRDHRQQQLADALDETGRRLPGPAPARRT